LIRAGRGRPGRLGLQRVELENAASLGCPDLSLGWEGGVICLPVFVAGKEIPFSSQVGGWGDKKEEERKEEMEGGTHGAAVRL